MVNNSKGAIAIRTMLIVLIGLAGLAVLLMMFFEDKLPAVKKNVESLVKEYSPSDESFSTLKTKKPDFESEHDANDYDLMVETIKKMMDSSKTECFAQFGTGSGGFGALIDVSIDIKFDPDTASTTITPRQTKIPIRDKIAVIPQMQPCVVGYKSSYAENFFDYFIEGSGKKGKFHYDVNQINIYYGTEDDDGNRMKVPEFPSDGAINSESNNFENLGWLFKADENSICFFPTNYQENADEDGIANEWFGYENEEEGNDIPARIKSGKLKEC